MSRQTILISNIIEHQATVNIGMIGHVSHGKSTVTYKLTGKKTQQHSSEKETNNRSVKLGYANCKIFYNSSNGTVRVVPSKIRTLKDPETGEEMRLIRHISFPDAPGHHEFMSTMIAGAKIMDSVFLLVAANQSVPQPQTYEHLLALQETNPEMKIVVLQNKLDLLDREESLEHHNQLEKFIDTTTVIKRENVNTVLPISAELGYNYSAICNYLATSSGLCEEREYDAPARMTIVRSFNINKPSTSVLELKGAVIGGTIHQGILTVGDHVELKPGVLKPTPKGAVLQPLIATVLSIQSDNNTDMRYAVPGGLIGMELTLDSGLSTGDKLVGYQLGHIGSLPDSYNIIEGELKMLKLLSGAANKLTTNSRNIKIVSSGSMTTAAIIKAVSKRGITLQTQLPLCLDEGSKLALLENGKLVATVTVTGGKLTFPEVYPEEYEEFAAWERPTYEVVDDICDLSLPVVESASYESLLSNIVFKDEKTVDSLRVPAIDIKYPTRHSTEILNIMDIIKALDQSCDTDEHIINIADLILNYFKVELTDTVRYNGEKLVMDLKRQREQVQKVFSLLISKVFRCPSCRNSCNSVITRPPRSKVYNRKCLNCPSITTFKSLIN